MLHDGMICLFFWFLKVDLFGNHGDQKRRKKLLGNKCQKIKVINHTFFLYNIRSNVMNIKALIYCIHYIYMQTHTHTQKIFTEILCIHILNYLICIYSRFSLFFMIYIYTPFLRKYPPFFFVI